MAKKSGNEMEKGIYSPAKDYNHGNSQSHVHSNFSSKFSSSSTGTSSVPAPLFNRNELRQRSLYRAIMAEFLSTLVFVLITIGTLIEHAHSQAPCGGTPSSSGSSSSLGMFGLARSFGGMIFILVYCTFGFSGAHINPAVTIGLFLARKLSLVRAVMYVVAQCAGAVCGAGLVKGLFRAYYIGPAADYNIATAYGEFKYADIITAFVLIYTLFSATEPQQNYFPVMGPLPVGLGVLIIYLAISNAMAEDRDGKGRISPARIDAYVVRFWIQWLLWGGPLLGAVAAAAYHQYSLILGSASKDKSMEDLNIPSVKRSI